MYSCWIFCTLLQDRDDQFMMADDPEAIPLATIPSYTSSHPTSYKSIQEPPKALTFTPIEGSIYATPPSSPPPPSPPTSTPSSSTPSLLRRCLRRATTGIRQGLATTHDIASALIGCVMSAFIRGILVISREPKTICDPFCLLICFVLAAGIVMGISSIPFILHYLSSK